MATVEQRITTLETEFRTELRHLATKEDLARLESRLTLRMAGMVVGLASLQLVGLGAVAAIVKLLG